ncbi:hypothetical protein KEM52_004716, partial [Ascosphaera acerosa]
MVSPPCNGHAHGHDRGIMPSVDAARHHLNTPFQTSRGEEADADFDDVAVPDVFAPQVFDTAMRDHAGGAEDDSSDGDDGADLDFDFGTNLGHARPAWSAVVKAQPGAT